MIRPIVRPLTTSAPPIDLFAAKFLLKQQISDFSLDDEALAEAVRAEFELGPFPRESDLFRLAKELGIQTHALPRSSPMDGVNTWDPDSGASIHLREEMTPARQETTLCHELREVLENAIKRVAPAYAGIATHDNRRMNPHSDRFAGFLLMQTEASIRLFASNGFDPVRFAEETGRSLSSVVLRLQSLFPNGCSVPAPVAGYWLYEPAYDRSRATPPSADELSARYVVGLNGFSRAKSGATSRVVSTVVPAKGTTVAASGDALRAFTLAAPTARMLPAVDLFGEQQYVIIAEPIVTRWGPSKVLLAAVRNDSLPFIHGWLERTNLLGRDPFDRHGRLR